MSKQRWRRGESRERVLQAALAAVADTGPRAVSGRSVAKEAGVFHPQIQQMFGSVDELVVTAVSAERDRFVAEVFASDELPSPLAIEQYPMFWRAIVQVLLDPGPIDLVEMTDGGPVGILAAQLEGREPDRREPLSTAIATAWFATPVGALIFRAPLQRGLGISSDDWAHCWARLGHRIEALGAVAELPASPPDSLPLGQVPTIEADRGRERLLLAAEQLLETRLETSVTGRELAEAASVNYGLVNHYFGSKKAVFDEALTNLHRRFLADIFDGEAAGLPRAEVSVFAEHRAFFRAWASRLLRDEATPDFELLGMERLMQQVVDARGITASQRSRRLDAAGDAMSAIALQLGWTILRPMSAAVDPSTLAELNGSLRSVHRWLLRDPAR